MLKKSIKLSGVGGCAMIPFNRSRNRARINCSRTITSAGMSRIQSKEGTDIYDNQTYMLWPHVTEDFGVQQKHAIQTSRLLKENVYSIAKENLEGQW